MGTVGVFLQSSRRRARFERLGRLFAARDKDDRASLSEAWMVLTGRLREMVRTDCAVRLEAELAPFTCRLSGMQGAGSTSFRNGTTDIVWFKNFCCEFLDMLAYRNLFTTIQS